MIKPFLHAAGMLMLGLVGLLAVDALHRAKATSPVLAGQEPREAVATSGSDRARPADDPRLAAVLDGLRRDLRATAAALAAGRRSEGIASLDGAFWLVQVLQANLESASPLSAKIEQARTAIQDGEPDRAGALASEAVDLIPRHVPSDQLATRRTPSDFVHATLLDAEGTVRGTIMRATADTIWIAPGSLPILGVIGPRPDRLDEVPTSSVLFGAVRRVGATMAIDTGVR